MAITTILTEREQRYLDRFTDDMFARAYRAGKAAQAAAEAAGEDCQLLLNKPDISPKLRSEFQATLAPDIAGKSLVELDALEARLDREDAND